MKKNTKLIFLFISVMFFLISNFSFLITDVYGDTHTAASCSYAAVSAAVNSASTGDTVLVPAGSATWNSGLSIDKGISLTGAGIGNTVITAGVDTMISYTPSDPSVNALFRLSGFTFDFAGTYNGFIISSGNTLILQTKVRIDHNRFQNIPMGSSQYQFIHHRGVRGVIDNNVFGLVSYPIRTEFSPLFIDNRPSGGQYLSGGIVEWNNFEGIVFGQVDNNIYFEDNVFEGVEWIVTDCQTGQRYAYRYNTINLTANTFPLFDMHGNQSSDFYSTMGGEIYGNNITGSRQGTFLDQRGGRVFIFNNNVTNTMGFQIREEYNDAISPVNYVGPNPPQMSQHVSGSYYWGNRKNFTGSLMTAYITTDCSQCHENGLAENVDFWEDAVPFTGATGVGCGTLANRPTTCTPGVGYWATNQNCSDLTGMVGANPATPISGTLYKCTAGNTWVAVGSPLTYPHPLRRESEDTTPPTNIAQVRDGTSVISDFVFTYSTSHLSANWEASTDMESGISGYKYAIGTRPAGTDVAGWTTLGNVPTVTKTGLSLTVGTTYYFSVKAVNGASLEGGATNSNGQYSRVWAPDTTGPVMGAVRDGTGNDIDTAGSQTQLQANWDAATEPETAVNLYSYAIGTTAGGTNIRGWTSIGVNPGITATGLGLTGGQVYYFSVKAQNTDGYWGQPANSNGQLVIGDTSPPGTPGAVRDGTSATADSVFTFSTTQLAANWDAAIDNESGISNYQFSIGTTPGGTQTSGWATIGNVLSVTKTGLSLSVGTTYYFSVKAQNGNGLQSGAANSNGQYVVQVDTADTSPPTTPAQVRDGLGADTGYTYSITQLSANWDDSTDTGSGIARYQYAIGTRPAGTDVANWTNTNDGINTEVTKGGLNLTIGTTYYFSVKAQNGVGLQSSARNSNGQVVLENSSVVLPVISNINVNVTASAATITWDTDQACAGYVEYGQTPVYGFVSEPGTAFVTSHGVSLTGLTPGTVYHYRIIVRDAGYVESLTADSTFVTPGGSIDGIKAYPNPCSISKDRKVTFLVGAGVKAEVKIYTVTGRLVKEIQDETVAGEIIWDTTNQDGEKILTGVYLYKVTVPNGDRTTGKLAVTK